MATEESDIKIKAEKDFAPYQRGLEGWMRKVLPEKSGLEVHDLTIPKGSGHSNETVFFSASWAGPGGKQSARYVARVEPPDGGVFPQQSPACAISVELQHRMMDAVARFCTIYIHLADRMTEAGLIPADQNMAVDNFVTDQLAGMLRE